MILEANPNESLDNNYVDIAFALGCNLSMSPPSKMDKVQAYNQYVQNVMNLN